MLQPIEVFPNARQTLRRSMKHLQSEVIASRWDDPRKHRVLDLSEHGMRVAAGTRLPRGETTLVSFTPPGWWVHGEVTVFARVAREAPRHDGHPATMAFEFLDLPEGARRELAQSLRGFPPPLPSGLSSGARRERTDLVWVDVLLTYTEDLGDRVNTFEVSDRIRASDLESLDPAPLGGLITGGRAPYRWRHAVAS